MNLKDQKTLRILQYSLNTILSNWDDDCEDDLAFESVSVEDVENLANWIDNHIEETII